MNLVVKPDRPLPRVQRRGPTGRRRSIRPGDFSRQNGPSRRKPPAGKVYGYGKGFFEYRLQVPARGRQGASRVDLLPVRGLGEGPPRAGGLARAGESAGLSPDGRRAPWTSTLAVTFNDRLIERLTLPDDPADARGVLSHLARVEHGSHGELVDGMITLNDSDRARLKAGEPLILRLSVPNDAPHAGGLVHLRGGDGRASARSDPRHSHARPAPRGTRRQPGHVRGPALGTLIAGRAPAETAPTAPRRSPRRVMGSATPRAATSPVNDRARIDHPASLFPRLVGPDGGMPLTRRPCRGASRKRSPLPVSNQWGWAPVTSISRKIV